MYFSIGNNCFLNYIFIHSWTFGTCTHMGHLQGKLISLTHWPLTILPQALKITAWCWLQVPSCTNPQQQGGKGGQQHWASLPVTKLFKTLMPFENVTWSDQDMDMLYMPGVRWNSSLTENILFYHSCVFPSYLSTTDMILTMLLAPYKAFWNPLQSTQAWDEGEDKHEKGGLW